MFRYLSIVKSFTFSAYRFSIQFTEDANLINFTQSLSSNVHRRSITLVNLFESVKVNYVILLAFIYLRKRGESTTCICILHKRTTCNCVQLQCTWRDKRACSRMQITRVGLSLRQIRKIPTLREHLNTLNTLYDALYARKSHSSRHVPYFRKTPEEC